MRTRYKRLLKLIRVLTHTSIFSPVDRIFKRPYCRLASKANEKTEKSKFVYKWSSLRNSCKNADCENIKVRTFKWFRNSNVQVLRYHIITTLTLLAHDLLFWTPSAWICTRFLKKVDNWYHSPQLEGWFLFFENSCATWKLLHNSKRNNVQIPSFSSSLYKDIL